MLAQLSLLYTVCRFNDDLMLRTGSVSGLIPVPPSHPVAGLIQQSRLIRGCNSTKRCCDRYFEGFEVESLNARPSDIPDSIRFDCRDTVPASQLRGIRQMSGFRMSCELQDMRWDEEVPSGRRYDLNERRPPYLELLTQGWCSRWRFRGRGSGEDYDDFLDLLESLQFITEDLSYNNNFEHPDDNSFEAKIQLSEDEDPPGDFDSWVIYTNYRQHKLRSEEVRCDKLPGLAAMRADGLKGSQVYTSLIPR